MGEDSAGRTIDGDAAVRVARVSRVGWSGWLVVLVRRDGITARSDEGRHLTVGTRSGGRPVLGHWRVVVLLVAGIAHRRHVLGSMWTVHARRLRSGGSTVAAWVDVLAAGAVHLARHGGGHGESTVVVGRHDVLGLRGEGLVGHVHALETMSESSHRVGGLHAVTLSLLTARDVLLLVGVHGSVAARVVAVVLASVVADVLRVHGCHVLESTVSWSRPAMRIAK